MTRRSSRPAPRDMRRADVGEIARALADRKQRAAVCLVGAGCSVTAGLPTAEEVVEYLREREAAVYARARHLVKRTARHRDAGAGRVARNLAPAEPQYAELMQCLESRKRYRLFQRWVGVSGLNRTHLGLAFLVWKKRVGRVFTTNFDDLALRACALYGVYPAVHDLAAMSRLEARDSDKLFKKSLVVEPSVFYLHGRHNGFEQIHHEGPATMQAERLEGVIADSRDRLWIVVGYSGESDPLFGTLEQAAGSSRGFYWVNREPPGDGIRDALARRGAAYVEVAGADEFFAELAAGLSTRRAHWLRLPRAHVDQVVAALGGNGPTPAPAAGADSTRAARRREGARLVARRTRLDHALSLLERAGAESDPGTVRALADGLTWRGERRLTRAPAQALDDFVRAVAVLDTVALVNECHACLLDWDRPAGRWSELIALYRAKRRAGDVRDRALLGQARALAALRPGMDARRAERALDQLRARIAGVRGRAGRPLLQLALGLVQATRATAGGLVRPGLAREAADALRQAVERCVHAPEERKPLLARVAHARRAAGTPRAPAALAAALEAVGDTLLTTNTRASAAR